MKSRAFHSVQIRRNASSRGGEGEKAERRTPPTHVDPVVLVALGGFVPVEDGGVDALEAVAGGEVPEVGCHRVEGEGGVLEGVCEEEARPEHHDADGDVRARVVPRGGRLPRAVHVRTRQDAVFRRFACFFK